MIRQTVIALALTAGAAQSDILLQSTTSTANSGLYDHILPIFTDATGINVNVVAVGTGQAIRNAANCDGDVLLVHAKAQEEAFVADGYGTDRRDVMYNDFVLVGPSDDPAAIAGSATAAEALARIAGAQSSFASRGDNSGTHTAERALWDAADIAPTGDWYRETGSGMGATLNVGVGMGAYALTDRATWVTFGNKGDLDILVQGDPALFNQYGVIPVSPDHCPSVNATEARAFADWLVSEPGQRAIASFTVEGEQLFVPNAAD